MTDRLFNRELSWLAFNDRVLALAGEPGIPLLERVKFIAIASSNLDEFFQVRVAALKDQVAVGLTVRSTDGLTPADQLHAIAGSVTAMVARQEAMWRDVLVPALAEAGVTVLAWDDLGAADRLELTEVF